MKGRCFVRATGAVLLALALVGLTIRVFPQGTTTKWVNPNGGNWSDASNWDNGVPDATKNAIIDLAGTYTVTLDVDATVASLTVGGASGTQTFAMTALRTLTLNGASTFGNNSVLNLSSGTLTGSGDVTVNGTMNWSGGTIKGTGAFTVNGTLNIGTGGMVLDGRTITNKGTANWTGTGYVSMKNTAVFENQAGAILDIQVDSAYGFSDAGGSGTRSINNAGTIIKSGGTRTFPIYVALNNNGIVNVNSGTMMLWGGGNSSGAFMGAIGTTLDFSAAGGGTHDLQASSSVTGDTVTFSGGTVNAAGTYNVSTTNIIGGTVNFSGGEAVMTTLTFSRGTLTGSGNVTVNGTMDWSGGTIKGTGAFTVNGTLNISGIGNMVLDGRTITNKGTANWMTGTGYVNMSNAAVFENQAGATLNLQVDSTYGFYDGGGSGTRSVNNAGTIIKSGGTGNFPISVAFNNSGLVQVLIGTLNTPTYTQTATGTLETGIGGLTAGEFGQLKVRGLAMLDGTFKATLVRNFQPKTGDQFQVMTFGSRSGNFTSFNLPEGFQAEFVGNGLTLTMVEGVVNQPPLAPTLLSPADNATVSDLSFTFQLSATDPDNNSLQFKIELIQDGQVVRTFDQTQNQTGWDKPSYANGETAKLTVSTSTIPLGTHQWRAQAFDGRTWGAVSETRSLTVANNPPLAPTLLSPADNETVSDFPFTLQLSATDLDGHNFKFKLELLQNGQVVHTFDQTQDQTGWDKPSYASGETANLRVPVVISPGTYQWRAQAFDGRDWGAVSETRTFNFLPELPLDTLKTVPLNSGETIRYKLNVPTADNLFVTVRVVEQAFNCIVSLIRGAQTVATQRGVDVLLQVPNPQAGEYALEITAFPSVKGEWVVRASPNLPIVKIGELFTGKIYRNDGYDWTQMDVPEGTKTLDFTLDAPGTSTFLEVWRGSFGSGEHWVGQSSNPPVRLTIQNPQPGRYYLRVQDHGVLQGSQVREYSIRVAGPKLTLSMQVAPNFAAPESEVTYTLTYGNNGQAPATDVVIEDTLPEQLELVEGSITGGGTYDAATRRITWNVGTVAAGTSGQAVNFTTKIKSGLAEGAQIVNTATIRSSEQPQPQEASATVVVSSPQISFDNTHTLFDEVKVTISGLSLPRGNGQQANPSSEPKVSLTFPAGAAVSNEIFADAVTVSEDGTQAVATFRLLGKVLSPVAPTVRFQHASLGERTWQGPVLDAPKIDSELLYNKTFLRLGREERFTIQVTNQHSFPESPQVTLDFSLENVPAGENLVAYYRLLDASGQEVGSGVFLPGQSSVSFLLPQVQPFKTANFTLLVRVASERSRPTPRVEPATITIIVTVVGTTVIVSWFASKILRSGCDTAIKYNMKIAAAQQGKELTDEQIEQIYNAIKQASDFATDWLKYAAMGATENALKEYIKAKYGSDLADGASIAYKVANGENPIETLIKFIAGKLVPGFSWYTLPATAAIKAFFAEAQRCLEDEKKAQALINQIREGNSSGRLRVTGAWDPNAKGGSLGVDGFVLGDALLTYTVSFENLSTATAAAEEVLIEDVLQSDLDLDSLTFTGFSVGDREILLPEGTKQIAEDIDLRPTKNLVIQVRSRLDPANRKLTITFKGIDPATGEHHPDGFLPPNVNPPEGDGYVTFQIHPKADAASGTVIKNKAKIIFDPHLGVNPPMETNEHILTLDKQPPTVQVTAMPSEHPLPSFPVQWEGTDDASGIARAEIWFSENGGPFQLFQILEPGETRQVSGRATFKGKFGHEYRFYAVAKDKVGNQQPHPDQPQATTRAGTPPRINAGLKMLTLPVISEIADPKQVFNFDEDKWAWYDPTTKQYVIYPDDRAKTLQVGKGFWARLGQDVTPNAKGELPDDTQPFAISLKGGSWNLIGNPWLVDLIWNLEALQVQVGNETKSLKNSQGIVEPYAWRWDGNNYQLVFDQNFLPNVDNKIPAWEGAWVYAHQDATLILPVSSRMATLAGRSRREKPEGWMARLAAKVGDERAEGIMGITTGRRLQVSEPPSPPEGKQEVQVLFLDKDGSPYKVDVRNGTAKQQVWDVVVAWSKEHGARSRKEEVVLTWDGVGYAPKDVSLTLVDLATGTRRYMRTQTAYRFVPSDGETERKFKVIAELGNDRPLRVVGLKATPMRGQGVVIEFALTKPAQVQAEVLTLTGRRVAVLEVPRSSGSLVHRLVWRGDRDDGANETKVSMGVYLVRVQAVDEEGRQVQAVTTVRMRP